MADTNDVKVLNSLITTTFDSIAGYRDAAEDAESAHRELFGSMAEERRRVVTELQQAVRALGGDPEDDGSVSGAAHRTFMNLKDLVTSRDEKAIVNEVERGEDHIKHKFEKALEDRDLRSAARAAIQNGYTSVRKGHDRVSAIKHAMK